MAQPAPLFVLVPTDAGFGTPAIGPFASRLSASDWRSDAAAQGLIPAGAYAVRQLTPPAPLIEPGL
jgi:hypothetical protein